MFLRSIVFLITKDSAIVFNRYSMPLVTSDPSFPMNTDRYKTKRSKLHRVIPFRENLFIYKHLVFDKVESFTVFLVIYIFFFFTFS